MKYYISRIKIHYEVVDHDVDEVIKTFRTADDAADWLDSVKDFVVFNQGSIEYKEDRMIHSASSDPLDYDVLTYTEISDFLEALTV